MRTSLKILSGVLLACILFGILVSVQALTLNPNISACAVVAAIISLIAMLYCLFYAFGGYRFKCADHIYRGFIFLYLLVILLRILCVLEITSNSYFIEPLIISLVLSYGFAVVLLLQPKADNKVFIGCVVALLICAAAYTIMYYIFAQQMHGMFMPTSFISLSLVAGASAIIKRLRENK